MSLGGTKACSGHKLAHLGNGMEAQASQTRDAALPPVISYLMLTKNIRTVTHRTTRQSAPKLDVIQHKLACQTNCLWQSSIVAKCNPAADLQKLTSGPDPSSSFQPTTLQAFPSVLSTLAKVMIPNPRKVQRHIKRG